MIDVLTDLSTQIVHVAGQRIRVTTAGEPIAGQTPLLLINGIGATADLFEPLRSAFHDHGGRYTIAFDAPGVGGSPVPSYPPTLRRLAGTVAGMLDELGHDEVDVLGLSWGGALAQELTYRHPGRVRRLILVATMHGWTSTPGRPEALAVLATPARYYFPAYLTAIAPTLYGREILDHPDLLSRHAHLRATRPPSPLGYTYQLAAMRRWTSLPWLPRLTQRTLVLAGDDDPIIPLSNLELIAARIPNSELEVVKGGGHLFLFLRADQMATRINQFLAWA